MRQRQRDPVSCLSWRQSLCPCTSKPCKYQLPQINGGVLQKRKHSISWKQRKSPAATWARQSVQPSRQTSSETQLTGYLSKWPRTAKARALSRIPFLQEVRNRNWSGCGSFSLCTRASERLRELQHSHWHSAQQRVPPCTTDMATSGQLICFPRREVNVMPANNQSPTAPLLSGAQSKGAGWVQ